MPTHLSRFVARGEQLVVRRMASLLAATVAVIALSAMPAHAAAAPSCGLHSRVQGTYARARTATAGVVVYGDSITYQTRDLLPASWGYDAYWGRATLPTVQRMAADMRARWTHLPRVVVMAVGTNDIAHADQMAALVAVTRGFLPRRVHVVWVDTYVDTTPDYVRVNAAIRSVPGVRVADWALPNSALARFGARAEDHPGSPLLVDGIHVNCRGAFVRTAETRAAVGA